jgi:hypothetical protein
MIRNLAQCPYCNRCEIALDDNPALVFNPDTDPQQPCPHLAWVDGRYAQWERSSLGINRVIGSTEFPWNPPDLDAGFVESLLPYLRELLNSGRNWAFAPAEGFVIRTLSAEEKATDKKGKSYVVWDVDGWALFAENPSAFWAALPACQERQLEALRVEEES